MEKKMTEEEAKRLVNKIKYQGVQPIIISVNEYGELVSKVEKYDEIIAKRKAHAKKMLAGKSKEWLHERAVKANKASQEKRCKK